MPPKTFTTLETMANARAALEWSGDAKHFLAVSANAQAAQDFGISARNILPLREWIGGRYSLWSGIGLSIAMSIGFDQFVELLRGARTMDEHFKTAPLRENAPVVMGLLSVWSRNFLGYGAQVVIPYAEDLRRLPCYIQQLEMESNGKSVDRNGQPVDYATAPVVFGEPGTNAQHAFFQLLHQGTDIIPCDFIAAIIPDHSLAEHHTQLLANMLAQAEALMEGQKNEATPHAAFAGNRPSSVLLLERLSPYHLGLLLALYEHKLFVQGILWNINSFDQWGVELGKKLATTLVEALHNSEKTAKMDASTAGLIAHIHNTQNQNS